MAAVLETVMERSPKWDELEDSLPASLTVTRTSERDIKQRHLIVSVDGERVATLLFGDSVTRDLEAGPHRLRVSNTLVWKTVELTAQFHPQFGILFASASAVQPGSLLPRPPALHACGDCMSTTSPKRQIVVLLVEDDVDVRRMFRLALAVEGFHVEEASDGLQALYKIEERPPDLVVLDLGLPAVDGLAVQQEIAGSALTRQIPVVIVTGSTADLTHVPVFCVLRKPVAPDELITTVRRCLQAGATSQIPGSPIVDRGSRS